MVKPCLVALLGLLTSGCAAAAPVTTAPAAASAEPNSGTPAASAPSAADPSGSPVFPIGWTGPVRPSSTTAVHDGRDKVGDAARPDVDIEQVIVDSSSQPQWRLELAAVPPKAAGLDPTRTVISYGLAFDTTDDGAADYEVGISNEASPAGDFRVWVTDLATGETDEQIGPPYGYPVEFAHPDEEGGSPEEEATMLFTFLGGSRPEGISGLTRVYGWASVEVDGEIVAWDYAPDVGWLSP